MPTYALLAPGIGMLLTRKAWHKVGPEFDSCAGNYLLFSRG
jgi:hypothetical protein